MKSIPVVDLGEGKIDNIITQSAVIHMLAECAGLQWFESWGTKTLSELGLPMMSPASIVKVYFRIIILHCISNLENGLFAILLYIL